MPQVKITHVAAKQAKDLMDQALADENFAKANRYRVTMARDLFRMYMVQEKYGPQEIDRRGAMPNSSSNIRALARMTPEELAEMNEQMAAGYPGKVG